MRRFKTNAVALAAAFCVGVTLSGCIYIARPVTGIPAGADWVALPLAGWIAEGDITIEAISLCNSQDCPKDTVIASLVARNQAARSLQTAFDDPQAMERLLNETSRRRHGKPPTASVQASKSRVAGHNAVAVNIIRDDGTRQAGAVMAGQRRGDEFHLLLVISHSLEAARAQVATTLTMRD